MSLPFVTVAIPAFNEERHIEACLRCVLAQDFPADHMEILVADGRSIDGTRDILTRLAAEEPRIRVIDNEQRWQAAGMNRILREARGDIIVRMDVRCEYARDYVRACIEALERTGADSVGGAQRAKANSGFGRALCAALTSPLGVGGAKYRSAEAEGFVDTVFLGAFPRRVFERVGLYDPLAVTNEDAELNQRLIESGGRVYLSRDIEVYYFPRESFRAVARQYYRYGRGRARTLLKHRKFLTLRPAVPFLMLVVGGALLCTSWLQPFALPAYGLYAAVCAVEAVRVGHRLGAAAILITWAIFPVLHVSHGMGFAAGLVRYGLRPDWDAGELLPPAPAR